jgi:hypothetical protein
VAPTGRRTKAIAAPSGLTRAWTSATGPEVSWRGGEPLAPDVQMADGLAERAVDRALRPVDRLTVGRQANPGRDLEQQEVLDADRTLRGRGHGPDYRRSIG